MGIFTADNIMNAIIGILFFLTAFYAFTYKIQSNKDKTPILDACIFIANIFICAIALLIYVSMFIWWIHNMIY